MYQPKTYTFRTTWGNGPVTGGCLVVAATIRDRRGDMTVNGRQAGRLAAGPDAGGLIRHGNDALHEVGDLRAARSWFEQAHRAADRAGDADAMATAALGIGGLWVHEHREAAAWAQAMSWQRRSLTVPNLSSGLAARLRARVAAEEDYRAGRHAEVLNVLQDARSRDDPQTLAMTLSLAHHCVLGPEHGRVRAALAEELLLTAARTERRIDRLMGMLWRTVDEFLDGDPHAERSLGQLRDALRAGGHLAVEFVVQAVTVMLKIRAGDLVQAEALAAECAARGDVCGDADAAGWYRGQLLAIRWFQGRVGELLPILTEQVHSSSLGALDDSLVAALAVAAATQGDHLCAAGALVRLGRGDLRRVPSSSSWLVTICAAVEAAALLGDVDTAATAYDLLRPFARLPVMVSLAIACLGSVEHTLGVAALTMGDPDRAVAHLRRAVRENLALGHWPAHCLSRHRLAHALSERGGPQDLDDARRETATAEREAARLSMVLPPPDALAARAPRAEQPGTATTRPAPWTGDGQRTARSADADVQIRLLGPVDITLAGTVYAVPGVRRRTVLAVLALHAGEVVSTDRLVDIVWGERAPRTAATTLQSHVSFLRRVIGARAAILTRSGGYLLDLGAQATDVAAAERLIRSGTQCTDPIDAIRYLQEALALWRGPPLRDIAGPAWTHDQAQHLSHLRLTAHKALAQARLALGQHAQLAAELDPLTREHPLDEQIHEHLMLALYRDGLQSEALVLYGRLRSALRDGLGIDPSRPLRDLHTAILRQDEALNQPRPPHTVGDRADRPCPLLASVGRRAGVSG